MNNRRKLLIALGSDVLATPLTALAQMSSKIWRIGVLHPQSRRPPGGRDQYTSFFEALGALGYVEGRSFAVRWLFADNDMQRLPALAAQLVEQKVDLIVTNGTPAVRAAQQATTAIPIVALTFADPVGSGFAKSLARPGGNITGTTTLGEDIVVKRLEILAEIVPRVTRFAYLMNPDNPLEARQIPLLEKAARKLNKEMVIVNARSESELSKAFELMGRERIAALVVAFDSVLSDSRQRIGELALKHKLPSVFYSGGTAAHGLVAYGPNFAQMARRAAALADKVLKGQKPADIPIEQPTHFNLVVNLKIAKALGVTIPPAVMVQATRVIE